MLIVPDFEMRLKRRQFIALLDQALALADGLTQYLNKIDDCLEQKFPQALAA